MNESELATLLARLRPRVHRYCARMVGSSFDGEDVVQDAFLQAARAASHTSEIEHPEAWLFRIAHNAALDFLRRRRRHAARLVDSPVDGVADASADAGARLAAAASLAAFVVLPPLQRSCVILVDVLGHTMSETVDILGVTTSSAKAALRRARIALQAMTRPSAEDARLSPEERRRLQNYADRFNARDFDGLRTQLANDVRLDLVNRTQLAGKKDVSVYFERYAAVADWYFEVGLAEGRPLLLVSDPGMPDRPLTQVVLLDWRGSDIVGIKDFKYAPYILDGLQISTS